jgi:hypothetical protein
MRAPVIAFLALTATAAAHPAEYAGQWFKCSPEWKSRYNFVLVEITSNNGGYVWLAEWGVPYAANGVGRIDERGNLVLRGCTSYRGNRDEECDPDSPLIFATLPKSLLEKPARPINQSLQQGKWLRTKGNAWKKLATLCAKLAEGQEKE